MIVSTRGRCAGPDPVVPGRGRARWRMPLYVLVDHDSARPARSSPALKDHQRADMSGADVRQGLGAEHLLAAIGPGRASS